MTPPTQPDAPKINCPSCNKTMRVAKDGIAGDYTAQCENRKCHYDGWSADTLEQLVSREVISPRGRPMSEQEQETEIVWKAALAAYEKDRA